jgi:hypothetical protein
MSEPVLLAGTDKRYDSGEYALHSVQVLLIPKRCWSDHDAVRPSIL